MPYLCRGCQVEGLKKCKQIRMQFLETMKRHLTCKTSKRFVNDLDAINIDGKDKRILTKLYWSQLTTISIDGELS